LVNKLFKQTFNLFELRLYALFGFDLLDLIFLLELIAFRLFSLSLFSGCICSMTS